MNNKLILATFLIITTAMMMNGASAVLDDFFGKFVKPKESTNPSAPNVAAGSAVKPSQNVNDMMPAGAMQQAQDLMSKFGGAGGKLANKGRRDVHETKKETVAEITNNASVKKTEKKEKKAKKVEVASIA